MASPTHHAMRFGVALALGTPLLATGDANATTLAPLSDEQLTDAASYVIRGEVTEVWTERDEDTIWTRARVKVDRVFKGPDTDELIIDTHGGVWGDEIQYIPASPMYSVGEDLVVFLDEIRDGRLVPVGMFLGKYTIRRAPAAERHHIMRWQPSRNQRFDHRFLPHPAESERLYLDDLLDRVETRLDHGWDGKAIPGVAPERLERVNTREWRRR